MSEELLGAYNKAEGLRLQAQTSILELQAQLSDLQKLCEEQRDTLDAIKEAIGGASSHPETGVSIVDDVRDLKAKVEEQRGEIERLKFGAEVRAELRAISDPYTEFQEGRMSKQAFISAISGPFESQLATQTERVRVLEVAIADIRGLHARCQQCGITSGEDECVTYQLAEQALNQKELK